MEWFLYLIYLLSNIIFGANGFLKVIFFFFFKDDFIHKARITWPIQKIKITKKKINRY